MNKSVRIPICLGAALLGGVFSVFSHALLLPVLALAAYMGANWGVFYLIPVLAGIAGGIFLAFSVSPSLIVTLVMLLSVPVFLTFYEKRRFPHRYALLGLTAIICLGTYLGITIEPMLAGKAPYADAVELWDTVFIPAVSSASSQSVSELMSGFSEIIPDILMFISLLWAQICALALILLLRLWHRVFRTQPAPMARFCDWRLPSSTLIGCIMLAAAIAAVYIARFSQAKAVALTLGLIIVSLLSVQGLAFMLFVLRYSRAPRGLRVFFWVAMALMFPYCFILLSFIGAREQIKNRRRLIRQKLSGADGMSKAERRAEEYAKYGYIREDAAGGGKKEQKDAPEPRPDNENTAEEEKTENGGEDE